MGQKLIHVFEKKIALYRRAPELSCAQRGNGEVHVRERERERERHVFDLSMRR